MNAPERAAPTAFLETKNRKANEHFSTTKVGLGKEPAFLE